MSNNQDNDQGFIGNFVDNIVSRSVGAMSLGVLGDPDPEDTSNYIYNDAGEQVGYIDEDGNYQKDD